MLELKAAATGVGSWLVVNDNDGAVQEGVDGVGIGVRDEGSQAGVDEGDQSGMGVILPELEGASELEGAKH
jgi:hypothetical protein